MVCLNKINSYHFIALLTNNRHYVIKAAVKFTQSLIQSCLAYQNHTKSINQDITFDAQAILFPFSMILHLSRLEVPNAISWLFKGLNLISHLCQKLPHMSIIFVDHSMTLKELQYRQHKQQSYDNRTNAKTMTRLFYGFYLCGRQRILRTDMERVSLLVLRHSV